MYFYLQISSLEHLLEAAKQSNSSALDKAKDNAEKQLSDLRYLFGWYH